MSLVQTLNLIEYDAWRKKRLNNVEALNLETWTAMDYNYCIRHDTFKLVAVRKNILLLI